MPQSGKARKSGKSAVGAEKQPRKSPLRAVRRLSAGRVHHCSPSWSADGEQLIFQTGEGPESAWVLADRRGRVARVLPGPAHGGAAVSTVGAVTFGRPPGEIWYSPGGAVPATRLLGGDGRYYSEPAWSPDGSRLVFRVADGEHAPGRLWLLELYTGMRRALPSLPGRSDGHPAFAPCGDELVLFFEGVQSGEAGVYRLSLDGGDGMLLRVCAGRWPAALGPDRVVVARPEAERLGSRLWLIDLSQRLTDGISPNWEVPLNAGAAEEPAAALRSHKPVLAYTVFRDGDSDAPGHREIVAARLGKSRPPVAPVANGEPLAAPPGVSA